MQRIAAVVPPRRSALVAMMPLGGIGRPRLLLSSSQIFDLRRRFFIFAFGAVLLRGGDTCFKHLEFGAEFLAGNAVRLEDVEQVGRREVQDLVGEVLDRTFLVGLLFAFGHDCGEHGIILVHNLCGGLVVGNGVGLGVCSGIDVPVEHNIRVVGVVIEIGGLLNTGGTAERVGKAVFPVKPRTEFDDTAFV